LDIDCFNTNMRPERLSEGLENNSPYNNEEVVSSSSRVDLNNLLRKIRDEEKKTKRNSVFFSAIALSILLVFGIILTL